MFHFRRGKPFRVDIGDFFELERPFQRGRVVVPAAQVNEVVGIGENAGQFFHLRRRFQHLADGVRQRQQCAGHFMVIGLVYGAAQFPDEQRQHGHHRHLAGKRFGGCHADLRPHMDIGPGVRGAGDGRADDVTNAIDKGACAPGNVNGRQGVGCLARLGNGNHHIVLADNGVAVAELGGILHLYRNAAQVFYEMLADERSVPGGTARYKNDAACLQEALFVVQDAGKDNLPRFRAHAATDAVHQRIRLLVDFLEHKVRETAFFQLGDGHLQLLDIDPGRLAV